MLPKKKALTASRQRIERQKSRKWRENESETEANKRRKEEATQCAVKLLHFRFEFLMNSTDTDIVIIYAPPNHRLFEGDHHFTADSLGHAHFSENGEIHMNDNVNWSLSFNYQPNTINMFYIIAQEICHSLGLNYISDLNSIMYPA
jgi:hypothetical protein